MRILKEIKRQLAQDHDFYHSSTMNQTLHFISGLQLIPAVILGLVFKNPISILLLITGWFTRQLGHFFFEPKSFDDQNKKSFEAKEKEKVGFNLARKRMLMIGMAIIVTTSIIQPDIVANIVYFCQDLWQLQINNGIDIILWGCGLVFLTGYILRTLFLIAFRSPKIGLGWFLKIMYDPINDLVLYHKAPINLVWKK